MLQVPFPRNEQFATTWSGQPAVTSGIRITGTTANALGAITEIFAACPFDTNFIEVIPNNTASSNSATKMLLDLLVGANGVEQLLIPHMPVGWSGPGDNADLELKCLPFPLKIPKGTRISGRVRTGLSSDTVDLILNLYGGFPNGMWSGVGVESLGGDESVSGGTLVTPGTTGNGDWVNFGTTTRNWRYILPVMCCNTDSSVNAGVESCDISIDNSTPLGGLEGFVTKTNTRESLKMINAKGRYCDIPAGSTVYLRSRFSGTAEQKRWVIHGVY